MSHFFCPYLSCAVELTVERLKHITERHPGILPKYQQQLEATLSNPDQIRQSAIDANALLFSKWFDTIRTGRYLIAVVISNSDSQRHWIITVYTARNFSKGEIIWQKEN